MNGYELPKYGYICKDCNQGVDFTQKTLPYVTPKKVDERVTEHRKRLAELTARQDPVLLSSCILGSPIWRKRFNIKPCRVVVAPLSTVLLSYFEDGNSINLYTLIKQHPEEILGNWCSCFGGKLAVSGSKSMSCVSGSKPMLDVSSTEPMFHVSGTEPISDVSGTEPMFDVSGTEPFWDVSGIEPNAGSIMSLLFLSLYQHLIVSLVCVFLTQFQYLYLTFFQFLF